MPDETTRATPSRLRVDTAIDTAVGAGVLCAFIALVAGVSMAAKRKLVTCPDGTYFPEGATDTACYVHPNLGAGISIASLSVTLAIILVFAAIAARAALRR